MKSNPNPLANRERLTKLGCQLLGFVVGLFIVAGPAAAQVGNGLCGTPIARFLNEFGPLAISVVMLGGTILATVLHGYSGLIRDPEQAKAYRDWRNRAIKAVLGAPILGYFIELMLGWLGLNVAGCIDIVPFL